MVPDKNGNYANVIQSHDSIQSLINSPEPYLSTLIGRYGNRIAKGRFQLDKKEYFLHINNGPNSLHGGKTGFNAKVWDARSNEQSHIGFEVYQSLWRRRLFWRGENNCSIYLHK